MATKIKLNKEHINKIELDQLDRKEKKFIRLLGKGRVLSRANIRDNSGEIISGTIIAIMATLVIISAKHTNLNGIGFDFSGTNTF